MLAIHEHGHLSIKPYRCSWNECAFTASQRSHVTRHIRIVHFNLPKTVKQQKERGIVDDRKPDDYIEVDEDLLARRLQ